VALANHLGLSAAVATQTHAQADDFCRRLASTFPSIPVIRFTSPWARNAELGPGVRCVTRAKDLPRRPCVAVGTSAKWASTAVPQPFEYLFIDEAWQMCWADFMLLSQVAPRFVLVGDPGQIDPVVPIDVSRWQTSRRPPHLPAPAVILRDSTLPVRSLSLPVTTRLPFDTAELIRPFYDFAFESWARPGSRRLELDGVQGGQRSGIDGALDLLTSGSVSMLTLRTPTGGPPPGEDVELARASAEVVRRLLARHARAITEVDAEPLLPEEIGLAASHRVMNTRLADALGDLRGAVRVDTPERWQGLERKVMVVVHPLSGVADPSAFDLATGRLCVMASRHQVGLVLVSRDHLGPMLAEYLPVADQPVGLPDEAGRGHARNLAVWRWMQERGRVVPL
jgi:hypothetical protein